MPAKKVNSINDVIWGNKSVETNARQLPPSRGPIGTDPEWNELVDTVQDPTIGHNHDGSNSRALSLSLFYQKVVDPSQPYPPPVKLAQRTFLFIESSVGSVVITPTDDAANDTTILDLNIQSTDAGLDSLVKNFAGVAGPGTGVASGNHGHPLGFAIASKTANYTVTTADLAIMATGGAGGITITLPTNNALITGMLVFVKKVDSGAGAVTVSRSGTDTIEGATSVSLAAQWNSVTLLGRGNGSWVKIAST